jgi:hypothetical protein
VPEPLTRQLIAVSWQDHGLVFPTRIGAPMAPTTFAEVEAGSAKRPGSRASGPTTSAIRRLTTRPGRAAARWCGTPLAVIALCITLLEGNLINGGSTIDGYTGGWLPHRSVGQDRCHPCAVAEH